MEDIRCRRKCVIFFLALILPTLTKGITTTHYNKPQDRKPNSKLINSPHIIRNLTAAERQKRLLPYINFYDSQNFNQPYVEEPYQSHQRYRLIPTTKQNSPPAQPTKFNELVGPAYPAGEGYRTQEILYSPQTKYTPFLESNALPGPFLPMSNAPQQKIKVTYTPVRPNEKVPNYSAIYDKLSQLKLQHADVGAQHYQPPPRYNAQQYIIGKRPQVTFIPVHEFQDPEFVPVETPKTFVHTYTPTSIEVPSPDANKYESQEYDSGEDLSTKILANKPNQGNTIDQPIRITNTNNHKYIQEPVALVEEPIRFSTQPQYVSTLAKYPQSHYLVQQLKQYHNQQHKQYLQEVVPNSKPHFIIVPQQPQYNEIPKPREHKVIKPIIFVEDENKPYTPPPIVTQTYRPVAEIQEIVTPHISPKNTHSLSEILKSLQDSNALPQTLTPDNIDDSIRTLVNILNSLKNGQKFKPQPIVVAEEGGNFQEHSTEAGVQLEHFHGHPPGTSVQIFPANTPEGGTPGKPGIDYPALSTIPQTSFNCKTQRYKGFFADPDTHCQVWHYCDLNGGQASFLCPNGTIFSQVALTCDWWFNVKCSTTTQLYVLNERLYKYIIPLTPKFPEDYSGPLVDKYLALKFREMETKMKNENKEKPDDKPEVDELQLLEDKNMEQAKIAAQGRT